MAVVGHRAVGIAETGVCHRVQRVEVDGALELVERAAESVRRPLIPVVTSAQVGLVGLRIDRGSLAQLLLLSRRQLEAERLGDLPGDLFLHRHQIRRVLAELLAPELRFAGRVDELGLDVQDVGMLRDPARQDRADVQRRADRRRVGLQAAVAEHEAARNDADGAELRQAVDDALGDAVGQVVELRTGGVDERQHRERLAARPRGAGHTHRGAGEQRAKRPAHVLRRREPPAGIALHGAGDHRAQLLRGQRVEAREIRRRVVQQPRDDLLRRRAGEQLARR